MNAIKLSLIYIPLIFGITPLMLVAQQADYTLREQTAPPHIKTRLVELRKRVSDRKANFTVGYTTVLDQPISAITGFKPPLDFDTFSKTHPARLAKILEAEKNASRDYQRRTGKVIVDALLAPAPSSPFLDWRRLGIKTRIQSQGGCGSCWDFGALAAYESSFQKRNGVTPDLSEQHVLDCSNVGSCDGGAHTSVFEYLISNGTVLESSYSPYKQVKGQCKWNGSGSHQAVAWSYVTLEKLPGTGWPRMPTVDQLKRDLVEHGPLTVGLWATDDFQAYTGGVFEELLPAGSKDPDGLTVGSDGTLMGPYQGANIYASNHMVLLIGWDDSRGAWLIKNSWGPWWGETGGYGNEKGYGWIKYNHKNIGLWGAWVRAESTALKPYIVKPDTRIPKEVVRPNPVERPVIRRPGL